MITDIGTEKYLPALKCLLAAQQLDADHPKVHSQGIRLKLALEGLSEPLPSATKEVVEASYLSQLSPADFASRNDEYAASHAHSAPHLHEIARVRHLLAPDSADTKSKSAADLQAALAVHDSTLSDAQTGLEIVDELALGSEPRTAYLEEARSTLR